jgi:hypothetical protein
MSSISWWGGKRWPRDAHAASHDDDDDRLGEGKEVTTSNDPVQQLHPNSGASKRVPGSRTRRCPLLHNDDACRCSKLCFCSSTGTLGRGEHVRRGEEGEITVKEVRQRMSEPFSEKRSRRTSKVGAGNCET